MPGGALGTTRLPLVGLVLPGIARRVPSIACTRIVVASRHYALRARPVRVDVIPRIGTNTLA